MGEARNPLRLATTRKYAQCGPVPRKATTKNESRSLRDDNKKDKSKKGKSERWAVSAQLFGFRIAGSCLPPLHFLGGRFANNTYENSRVSGKRDSAEVWCAGSGRRDGDYPRRGRYRGEELVWRGE